MENITAGENLNQRPRLTETSMSANASKKIARRALPPQGVSETKRAGVQR